MVKGILNLPLMQPVSSGHMEGLTLAVRSSGLTKVACIFLDRCCHTHDCCYGLMSSLGCDPKRDIYSYDFQKDNVFCSMWQ